MIEILPYSENDFSGMEAAHDAARMQELTLAGLAEAFLPLLFHRANHVSLHFAPFPGAELVPAV